MSEPATWSIPPGGPGDCTPGCGLCCDPIILTWPLAEVTRWATGKFEDLPDPTTDDGWARWVAAGWSDDQRDHAVHRMSDGYDRRNADFLAEHWHVVEGPEREASQGVQRVACDAFDRHTRTCTVWATGEQPPICSGFPRYGRPPGDPQTDAYATMTSCSYVADVRQLLPIVEVT